MKFHLVLLISFSTMVARAQVHLTEGFEGGSRPEGWTEENVVGTEPWRYRNGGHSPNDNNWQVPADAEDITRNPQSAYAGTYNAIFFKQGTGNERTKLITPELNVLGATALELSFQLCQIPWTFEGSTNWDVLRVYYKTTAEGPWVLLHEYLDKTFDWEEKQILLPNPSETYYVAFEGHTRWGYGTCIDEIKIEETALQPMYIGEIDFVQPFSNFVPSGSEDVPILRADVKVFGNTDSVELDYVHFTSRNTSDADLQPGGVKLYATSTQNFDKSNPLGSPTDFVDGVASFTNLEHILPAGISYLWLTCDVLDTAVHENLLDAMMAANGLRANGLLYPASDQDPEGYREIYRTRYKEDFDDGHSWTLTGEFEVGTPNGMGGDLGNPNPDAAYSGTMSLGTDLSGQGANPYLYEPGLSEAGAYLATSPNVDALYYKNLNLFFMRYLNIEVWDEAHIEISKDNGVTWTSIWENAYYTDFQWTQERLVIPDAYTRSEQLRIRFRLGPTTSFNQYTGWNIDDMYLTGEFISKDVGVSDWIYPLSGSGHSDNDSVTVRIRNYGGAEIVDPVPVAYSFDGGSTWTINQMNEDIPVGGWVDFTFPTRADLSVPGLRANVLAKTAMPGDQYTSNDQFSTEVYILPTYVPPYAQDFEQEDGSWRAVGNRVWEYGTPGGNTINAAASGSKVWATSLSDRYGNVLSDVNQIIFEDDFETIGDWTFSGEFERETPSNIYLPYFAKSGYFCIGTDLSGQGTQPHYYENGIAEASAYTATTPAINVSEYSNLRIRYASWISVQDGDSVRLEVSPDNGSTWHTIWKNEGGMYEWQFEEREFSIPDEYIFTNQMKIRFSLFYSSASGPVGEGWFIDDFRLVGDYVDNSGIRLHTASFDLRGVRSPMVSAKLWMDSEQDVDGLTFMYSLDNGDSWVPVSNSSGNDAYWNWYTGQAVEALGTNGWSGQSGGWIEVKHLLPAAVVNQADVQFCFLFAANKTNNMFDGAAIDDFRIMEAPKDLDLLSIIAPVSACELGTSEHFNISARNTGLYDLEAGDTLHFGYQVEHDAGTQWEEESYILDQNWPVGSNLSLVLDTPFDFSLPGNYHNTVYFTTEDPHFYGPVSGDTLEMNIEVSRPNVDLGNDISTLYPDTVVLRAYSGVPGQTYLWQDGSSDSLFNVSINGVYHVRVSNGLGCTSSDTIEVKQLVADVGITAWLGPDSDCEINGTQQVRVLVENLGSDTVEIGETLSLAGTINGGSFFEDELVMDYRFMPGMSFEHTFSTGMDFSVPGDYVMKVYSSLANDMNYVNDTLDHLLQNYGYPDANLGNDTVVEAAQYLLTPGVGYPEYLWQDGSGGESFLVTEEGPAQYHVRIDDGNGCISTDTVVVTLDITDLELEELISPSTSCELSNSITVSARIRNAGNQIISSGEQLMIAYQIDNGDPVQENYTLAQDLLPGHSFDFIFGTTENVVTGLWYDFTVYLDYAPDAIPGNDTIITSVGVFETPNIDLGEDTIIIGFEHTLDAGGGYESYLWQDGSTLQTYTITQPGIGNYNVTVTNDNGCTAYDEVNIMLAVPDVGIQEVLNPLTRCSMGASEQVSLMVKNYGNVEIPVGAEITVSYSLNGSDEITEPLVLSEDLASGSVIEHVFSVVEDLSATGTYDIYAYTSYADDIIASNDMVLVSAVHYGAPDIQIGDGADSILVDAPITLEVTEGYPSYLWQDGSTETFYEINEASAGWYKVIVSAENGCETHDSVFVAYDVPDLIMYGIASPISSCELTENTTISLEVMNNGFTALPAGETLTMSYSVNSGSSILQDFVLDSDFLWGTTRSFEFQVGQDFSAIGSYEISAYIFFNMDQNLSNNLLISNIDHWEPPVVEINNGADTVKGDLPLTLDAGTGYLSYLWSNQETTSNIQASSYGEYWVLVSDINGCIGGDTVLVSSLTGTGDQLLSSGQLNIYPNPAHEFFRIDLNLDREMDVKLELYNMANALVYMQDLKRSRNRTVDVDVHDLSPGTYYLRLYTDGEPHHYLVVVRD